MRAAAGDSVAMMSRVLWIGALGVWCSLAPAAGPVAAEDADQALGRWAILATPQLQETGLPDLVAAKLSEAEAVELVERERMDAILGELELSACLNKDSSLLQDIPMNPMIVPPASQATRRSARRWDGQRIETFTFRHKHLEMPAVGIVTFTQRGPQCRMFRINVSGAAAPACWSTCRLTETLGVKKRRACR